MIASITPVLVAFDLLLFFLGIAVFLIFFDTARHESDPTKKAKYRSIAWLGFKIPLLIMLFIMAVWGLANAIGA